VVVHPVAKEDITSSGIHVVDVRTQTHAEGTVVAVGADVKEIKVGETIVYSPLFFEELNLDKVMHHVIDEQDVHAILE